MASRPILSSIPAFDAGFGTDEAPVFSFSLEYGSYVARKNRVIISEYDTRNVVYDCTLTTMKLTHKLHKSENAEPEEGNIEEQTVKYALENNKKYIAQVKVYDRDGNESLASNEVIFYCYKKPVLTFENFKNYDNSNGVYSVNSTSVSFSVKYEQENSLPINSYTFELKDSLGNILDSSGTKYNAAYGELLKWTVGGIEETALNDSGELEPNSEYKIICTVETKHGCIVKTEQKFIVRLECSGVGSLIQVENVGDGTVTINSNYKIMNVICSNDHPTYVLDENGNPYAIDLTTGDSVQFVDGFVMKEPYEIIMCGKFDVGNLVTFQHLKTTDNGTEDAAMKGILARKKITYTTVPYYYFSFSVIKNGITYEIRSDYFKYSSNPVPAEIDLSYQNGQYELQVNLLTDSNTYDDIYIVTDDDKGNVEIAFLNDYSVNHVDGLVTLTNYNLATENDTQGNVSLVVDHSTLSYYSVTKNVVLRDAILNITDDDNGNVILSNVSVVSDDNNGNISITI